MLALIFALQFLVMFMLWRGRTKSAHWLFWATLLLTAFWFKHHVTEPLPLAF